MEALSPTQASTDSNDSESIARSESAGANKDMNVFAARPSKRYKVYSHELVPMPDPEPLHPRYLVSRLALDDEDAMYMHFGELDTHELTVCTHEDTLLIVMANCHFDPQTPIMYYELEVNSDALVVSMAIERRYIGLELIGGAARDTEALARAAASSAQPDPKINTRADSRYPLALKSRFLQDPLDEYEWAVSEDVLFDGSHNVAQRTQPAVQTTHRIGLLLDQSNRTLTATRDGKIVGSTRVNANVSRLNRDIGLIPLFRLQKNAHARAFFSASDVPSDAFKFDLRAYVEQRQSDIVSYINRGPVSPDVLVHAERKKKGEVEESERRAETPDSVQTGTIGFFRDYFEYYGYEMAARACSADALRASTQARALIRRTIMSGEAQALPSVMLSTLNLQISAELQGRVSQHAAMEGAFRYLAENTVPSKSELAAHLTYDAAMLLITPANAHERDAARGTILSARAALLDSVLSELTEALGEKFSSSAFSSQHPVLQNLVKSFEDNIAKSSIGSHGTVPLLRGYLRREYAAEYGKSASAAP